MARFHALTAFLLLALTALALPARAAERLGSYEALMAALEGGRDVNVVIRYAKTTIKDEEGKDVPAPDAVGGMEMKAWEWFAKGLVRNDRAYVAASHTVLIQMRGAPTYNYVRLRIYEDGVVEITAQYLDPKTFEVSMNQVYMGRISNGQDENAVSFFAD